jgi:methylenetetrahydrofolate reductase (NADPH)
MRAADFATTQFFFDIDHYLSLVNDLADLGITKPVVPGIMPVTNIAQVERMAELSGAAFPAWLRERLESGASPEDVRRIGVEAATELSAKLLEAGAPGLHFYTMNKSTATLEIYAQLGLPVV